jgi:hypothetical protein
LKNLITIIDYNKQESLDFTKNILSLDPLAAKIAAFGLNPIEINGHSFAVEIQDILIVATISTGFSDAVVRSPSNGTLDIEFVIFGRKFLSTNSSNTRLLVLSPIVSVLPSILAAPVTSLLTLTVTGAGGFGSSGGKLEGKLSSLNVLADVVSDTIATISVSGPILGTMFSTARTDPIDIEITSATGRVFRSYSTASQIFVRSLQYVQLLLTLQANISSFCPTCSALHDFKSTFCSLLSLQSKQLQIMSVYAGSVNIVLNVISIPAVSNVMKLLKPEPPVSSSAE